MSWLVSTCQGGQGNTKYIHSVHAYRRGRLCVFNVSVQMQSTAARSAHKGQLTNNCITSAMHRMVQPATVYHVFGLFSAAECLGRMVKAVSDR